MLKHKNDDGKIAVLVSYGFGAGWSTWGSCDVDFLTMDKTLVMMKMTNTPEEEVKKYIKKTKDVEQYMGGWDAIVIEWVDEGTSFIVDEYDGSESLVIKDQLQYIVA